MKNAEIIERLHAINKWLRQGLWTEVMVDLDGLIADLEAEDDVA